MVRKAVFERKENVGNVQGIAEMHHVIAPEDAGGNVRMYAKAVLKPGAKIAWHQHTGETEPYFILSGHGIFTDHDKSRTEVSAGDVCLIQEGQFHSIENASEEDLAFMALIYAVPGDVPAMR